MCEEIGKLNFNAGEHVFLENIEIQVTKNMAAVLRNCNPWAEILTKI